MNQYACRNNQQLDLTTILFCSWLHRKLNRLKEDVHNKNLTYEIHSGQFDMMVIKNPENVHKIFFQPISMDFIVFLWNSSPVQPFDSLTFDILTHFWHMTYYLNCLSPSQGYFFLLILSRKWPKRALQIPKFHWRNK